MKVRNDRGTPPVNSQPNQLQTTPPNLHPAMLSSMPELFKPITITFDEELPAEQRSHVTTRAIEVHHHAFAIRANAMGICLSLYRCREAYGNGASRAKSSKNGWGEFCQKNFSHLNLSESNIRAAVRSGEILDKMQQAEPDGAAMFSRLSRAALFALGDSPELVAEVKQILYENPDDAPTAAEIKTLRESLRVQSESSGRAEAELAQAIQKLSAADIVTADVNHMLAERESEVVKLKAENADLKKAAMTPVESLVPALPKGVKTEAELLESINSSIVDKKGALQRVDLQFESAQGKLTALQRTLAQHEQTADAMAQLEADISSMISKYPDVLLQKMQDTSPAVKSALSKIAVKLHTLANHIERS